MALCVLSVQNRIMYILPHLQRVLRSHFLPAFTSEAKYLNLSTHSFLVRPGTAAAMTSQRFSVDAGYFRRAASSALCSAVVHSLATDVDEAAPVEVEGLATGVEEAGAALAGAAVAGLASVPFVVAEAVVAGAVFVVEAAGFIATGVVVLVVPFATAGVAAAGEEEDAISSEV